MALCDRASMAMRRRPHPRHGPSTWPRQAAGGPLVWAQAYPLVDELELEVALAPVWVGLRARLQRVPLILPAAQILAGQEGREAMGGRPQALLGVDPQPLP